MTGENPNNKKNSIGKIKNKQERPALLLLHGPNLNMLGRRDPEHYGSFTLKDVEYSVRVQADAMGFDLYCYQSNHEGFLIDQIHETMDFCEGMLINAGALTHYSYALRDAIELCPVPVMEIHISDIHKREGFRGVSVISDVCADQVSGFGLDSYRIGLEKLVEMLARKEHEENE